MIQDAYISTGGFCEYFHRDNSMLHIRHPSPGGDHKAVDSFFLHRVTPLEMVSSWFYADNCAQYQHLNFDVTCTWKMWQESVLINVEGKVVQRSVAHQHGTGAM
jgi:hypothetical protein